VTNPVPQAILDALTDVPMPSVPTCALPESRQRVDEVELPLITCGTLVVGSGAAGLRAAVELQRRGENVLVASMALYGGTSACSGSDKQTLHTAGTSNRGDDFVALAKALGAGGCMDLDTAYVEAVGSLHTLIGLQYLGLPLPQDRFGAVLRYQTDHDDVGRATSCGPRTSRLMVKVLAAEAVRLGIPMLRKCEVVRLLTETIEGVERVVGALAIDQDRRGTDHGFIIIRCHNVVLANGGPGELYRDSVYPAHCYGGLGLAIEAGLALTNLSESQFGIGTRRTEFPWNLSGTYVQVMPYVFSRDADGTEYNFLAEHYRTTRELVSNVFRKGYQWPFHATRMLDFGSSLVDLAIAIETRRGRTVYLDFQRNPQPGADGKVFSLDDLDDDVAAYLRNNDALQATPLERLQRMNPLAIELYRMHGHDLTCDPLPFNVNNQHMNGGVAVDLWNESSLPGCFAVGEVAGTHGVTRPGGAALNAGQVGGLRAAEQIASRHRDLPDSSLGVEAQRQISAALTMVRSSLEQSAGRTIADVRSEIQTRMSDHAGFLCAVEGIPGALADAIALRRAVFAHGFAQVRPAQVVDVFRWRHLALASEAVLTAIARHVADGGGSRGARAYLAADGTAVPQGRSGPLRDYRFRVERSEDRTYKLMVRWTGDGFATERQPLRGMEPPSGIFFEKNWGPFLTGAVYQPGFAHR
jgi:succinate dehydrogenase / fumarate reductase, flavoprotein subunit